MKLEAFNGLTHPARTTLLITCCHSSNWADQVAQLAPFTSIEAVYEAAAQCWSMVEEADILEAFTGHPQIGDLEALRNKYSATATGEQGQIATADDAVLERLKNQNQAYLDRFGFIFIVCATGKSAREMLDLLEARLPNSREQEVANGAREQGAITQLRLKKLFEE